MSHDDLYRHVDALRAELESLPEGHEARARLGAIADKIEDDLDDDDDIADRVRDAIDRFEVDHPQATAILARVLDVLSGAGI